jgi:hypothetical protein
MKRIASAASFRGAAFRHGAMFRAGSFRALGRCGCVTLGNAGLVHVADVPLYGCRKGRKRRDQVGNLQ